MSGISYGSIPCPPPGIYPNMAFEEYCQIDALNHTRLRRMARSPRHFRFPPPDALTESKNTGTAFHELYLEPDRFHSRVILGPINERTGKCFGHDTKAWGEVVAANPGKLVVSKETMEELRGLGAEFSADEDIQSILAHPDAMREVTLIWDDPPAPIGVGTGLRCKCKLDLFVPFMLRADIKTSEKSVAPGAWVHSAEKFGYITQDGMYGLACGALAPMFPQLARKNGKPLESYFLAGELEGPAHGVAIYEWDEATLKASRALVQEWMLKVKRCTDGDEWPGYQKGPQKVKAPDYWLRSFVDDETEG